MIRPIIRLLIPSWQVFKVKRNVFFFEIAKVYSIVFTFLHLNGKTGLIASACSLFGFPDGHTVSLPSVLPFFDAESYLSMKLFFHDQLLPFISKATSKRMKE